MAWNDISSAPRNGVWVLAACTVAPAVGLVMVRWQNGGWYGSDSRAPFDPSHWMPLPSAPLGLVR